MAQTPREAPELTTAARDEELLEEFGVLSEFEYPDVTVG